MVILAEWTICLKSELLNVQSFQSIEAHRAALISVSSALN